MTRAARLDRLPADVPPPPGFDETSWAVAVCDGKIWAYRPSPAPFQPQEFYVWDDPGWEDRTEHGSVPYHTLLGLVVKP